MKILIIDFEGFKCKNQFIFQEIAMYDYYHNVYNNYFLKLPKFTECKHKTYLEHHVNFIPSILGTTKYQKIIDLITQYDIIIVNGKKKFNIMKNILKKKIINIQQYAMPLQNIQYALSKCKFIKHLNIKNCAINKLEIMVNKMKDNGIIQKINDYK